MAVNEAHARGRARRFFAWWTTARVIAATGAIVALAAVMGLFVTKDSNSGSGPGTTLDTTTTTAPRTTPPRATGPPTTPPPTTAPPTTAPPTTLPAVTTVTALHPYAVLQPEPDGTVHDDIYFDSLYGNVSLLDHVLRATENGKSVGFVDPGPVGDLVEGGRGIRLTSPSPSALLALTTSNQTGHVGVVVIKVDNVIAFTCPSLTSGVTARANCEAP